MTAGTGSPSNRAPIPQWFPTNTSDSRDHIKTYNGLVNWTLRKVMISVRMCTMATGIKGNFGGVGSEKGLRIMVNS